MNTPMRRPQPGPPPPAVGAQTAIRTARHRRQRARLLTGGGVAAALIGVVAVSVLTGSTQVLSEDRLNVAASPTAGPEASDPPASAQPSTTPSATSTAATSASPSVAADPSAPAPASGDDGQSPSGEPAAGQDSTTRYRTPAMTRTATPVRTAPAGSRFCASHSTDNQVKRRLNWCFVVRAEATPAGHRLSLEICRDDTGPGTLSYRDALETDLAVLAGDQEVWRWSADHSPQGASHTLQVGSVQCFTWTVDWTDVDRSGAPLKPGSYSLLATTFASELQELPSERTTFEIS